MCNNLLAVLVLTFAAACNAAAYLAAEEPAAATDPKQSLADKILATEPVIPEGVVYRKCSAEKNAKAIDKLSRLLLATEAKGVPNDLVASPLICGPGMWWNLKQDAELQKMKGGRVEIKVPTRKVLQKLEGKLFQNPAAAITFWRAFLRKYKLDSEATIRRPTAKELVLYWVMISFDVTEPIFVIENNQAVILAHFNDAGEIFWIDDLKQVSFSDNK